MREAFGIVTDHLKYVRFARGMRLRESVETILEEKGISRIRIRKLPLSIGIPLIQSATLEENDELQDIWAQILANSLDLTAEEAKKAFVSILENMDTLEVRLLDALVNAPEELKAKDGGDLTAAEIVGVIEARHGPLGDTSPREIHVAIWNLVRLGGAVPTILANGLSAKMVRATELGQALVAACSPSPSDTTERPMSQS